MKRTEQVGLKACANGGAILMLFLGGFALGSHLEQEKGCQAKTVDRLSKIAVVMSYGLVLGFGVYNVTTTARNKDEKNDLPLPPS